MINEYFQDDVHDLEGGASAVGAVGEYLFGKPVQAKVVFNFGTLESGKEVEGEQKKTFIVETTDNKTLNQIIKKAYKDYKLPASNETESQSYEASEPFEDDNQNMHTINNFDNLFRCRFFHGKVEIEPDLGFGANNSIESIKQIDINNVNYKQTIKKTLESKGIKTAEKPEKPKITINLYFLNMKMYSIINFIIVMYIYLKLEELKKQTTQKLEPNLLTNINDVTRLMMFKNIQTVYNDHIEPSRFINKIMGKSLPKLRDDLNKGVQDSNELLNTNINVSEKNPKFDKFIMLLLKKINDFDTNKIIFRFFESTKNKSAMKQLIEEFKSTPLNEMAIKYTFDNEDDDEDQQEDSVAPVGDENTEKNFTTLINGLDNEELRDIATRILKNQDIEIQIDSFFQSLSK